MNFEYSEEQQLLKESLVRWAQDNYSFEQRRMGTDNQFGFDPQHWSTFAELGWLSIPFSEKYGGYGGSIIDLAAIMEEFGRALVVEPFFSSVLLFGGLLEQCTVDEVKAQLIPKIIDGSLMGAVAMYEPQSRFDISNVQTVATDAGVISGSKCLVLGGAQADQLIVVARTSGGQQDEFGLSLFLVDPASEGVTVNAVALMDGQRAADIQFNNAQGRLISGLDEGIAPLLAVMQAAHVALCAEALGIMEKLNRTTVEYTKTRKQFGTTISSFQALQHRMVDTFMAYEQCKSLLIGTLCELSDNATPDQRARKIVTALRTLVAKNGKLIGDEAIQIHGGMGLTDELDVGHYVKRLIMINLMFGDEIYFQKRFNQIAYTENAATSEAPVSG
jgi:hypothetical protein